MSVALGRFDHRAIDTGVGELVHERGNIAAFLCHVLAYRGVRRVLRPTDNGDMLRTASSAPSVPLNRHAVVAMGSTSFPRGRHQVASSLA